MKHIIINCDKDLKIIDWTPFNNLTSNNFPIIHEKQLITFALDNLFVEGYIFRQCFTHTKGTHFLCVNEYCNKKNQPNMRKYLVSSNSMNESLYDNQTDDNQSENLYGEISNNDSNYVKIYDQSAKYNHLSEFDSKSNIHKHDNLKNYNSIHQTTHKDQRKSPTNSYTTVNSHNYPIYEDMSRKTKYNEI